MNKSMKTALVASAVASLFANAAFAGEKATEKTKEAAAVMCSGVNECKGKGGCKGGEGGCKGKNSCKGKGGCATDGSKPPQE